MFLDDSKLFERVKLYARTHNRIVAEHKKLGYGSDGTVWRSRETAIKAIHHEYNYQVERDSYLRLREANVNSVGEFALPRLLNHDDDLMIIELEIVEPPYILDFGKVYLDIPPIYWNDQQIRTNAYEEWQERFDSHWESVAAAMAWLERLGIYYVDPRPSNICTDGLE
ncbi:hypothetical protein [Aeoliella mucimassa]|uniref:Protein kinase domain-containing protein n=1 Tax=Aeoliella mucimassa TaxID=2527972 RepID=A0A518AR03_9BACT|nr:hypothetical protein [Aeoliella mucimassa]QDU57150.1 hypothetical protein Pan181_33640 [Aeoliella mucimassa]